MAIRRPKIFRAKPEAEKLKTPQELRWENIMKFRQASSKLIGSIYDLVNAAIINIDPTSLSNEPAVQVRGHPASNQLTYSSDEFALTRMRRWLTAAENTQENMHHNGLKVRRYIDADTVTASLGPRSWWEVDIRDSGVVRISANNYPEGKSCLEGLHEATKDKLKLKPTANDFGVRNMGLNKGEVALEFGLNQPASSRIELYVPAKIILEENRALEYVHQEINSAFADERFSGNAFDSTLVTG